MFETSSKTCYDVDNLKDQETHPSPVDEIRTKKPDNAEGIKGHREVGGGPESNCADPADHGCIVG